jgi:cytochrome b561
MTAPLRSDAQPSVAFASAVRHQTYDSLTIAFHWIIAAMVLLQFVLVLWPGVMKGAVTLHRNLGLLILTLVVLRGAWRLTLGRRSYAAAAEPILLKLAAKASHLTIYALLIVTPLLGWVYLDAKANIVDEMGLELPTLVYYDRGLAKTVYAWKQVAAYALLALIFAHAFAAIVYHSIIRRDGVLNSMLPRRFRRAAGVAVALGLLSLPSPVTAAEPAFDVDKFAAEMAASLAKACPMASPSDVAAQEACRAAIGRGAESRMREDYILFGGQQPSKFWLRDKKTSVFRGDLFQDLYMSLYMYTGKFRVQDAPDGLKVIGVQAYFRNGLPPGRYPYPFWHSNAKWEAYEKSNELRFRVSKAGKVIFAYRADIGSDENRGPYRHVERPPFIGAWMWRDDQGGAEPAATLFSEWYSKDNPNLAPLDDAYRKMATSFREADCTVCHQPEGHKGMNKLVLLQTPVHAAIHIDAVLDEVRSGKMPLDVYDDPVKLEPDLKERLIANGEAFKKTIEAADAWERDNGRPKARPAAASK